MIRAKQIPAWWLTYADIAVVVLSVFGCVLSFVEFLNVISQSRYLTGTALVLIVVLQAAALVQLFRSPLDNRVRPNRRFSIFMSACAGTSALEVIYFSHSYMTDSPALYGLALVLILWVIALIALQWLLTEKQSD